MLILGSILDGPSDEVINRLIHTFIGNLLVLFRDSIKEVRKTTAWTISKICEFNSRYILNSTLFNQIIPEVINSLKDVPAVATHCCWALLNLIEKSEGYSIFTTDQIDMIINALLIAASRKDSIGSEHSLQISSFSAINTIIEKAPREAIHLVEQKIPHFVLLLKQSIHGSGNDYTQSFICSALQSAFGRASHNAISEETARDFMETILTIFKVRQNVIEEAIQAAGTLAGNIEIRFTKYLGQFVPFLIWALNKQDTPTVCKAGTMVVGDLARALGREMAPYLHEIVPALLRNLESSTISTDVKIQSIEALADLASSTRQEFLKYVAQVLAFIEGAANLSVNEFQSNNPDLNEYLLQLREAILEFYVGLLQGLSEMNQIDTIFLKIPNIIQYTILVTCEKYNPSYALHNSALGLLGDIAYAYKRRVAEHLRNPNVNTYLIKFKASADPKLREIAIYSYDQINSI